VRKQTSILAFASLAQTVSAGMPEDFSSFGVFERDVCDGTLALQGAVQVEELAVDLGDDHGGAHLLGNILEKLARSGLPSFGGDNRRVSVAEIESDIDLGMRLVFHLFEILLPQFLK
jgi:hypothetical protein